MPHVLTRGGARRVHAVMVGFCTVLLGAGTVYGDTAPAPGLQGFSPDHAAAELQREARFDSNLSAADLRSWMEQLSSAPNHVGSAHDKANAEFLLQKFRE